MVIHSKFAPTTMRSYTHIYRCHVGPRFATVPAISIGPAEVSEYQSELRMTKKLLDEEETLRPATRNRIIFLIKTILNWGVKNRLISHNPILEVEKEDEENIRETVVSENQLSALLDHADDYEAAYILLLRDSGLRRREACRIQWAHLRDHDPDPTAWSVYVTWKTAKLGQARYTILTSAPWRPYADYHVPVSSFSPHPRATLSTLAKITCSFVSAKCATGQGCGDLTVTSPSTTYGAHSPPSSGRRE
jgi:integrase